MIRFGLLVGLFVLSLFQTMMLMHIVDILSSTATGDVHVQVLDDCNNNVYGK